MAGDTVRVLFWQRTASDTRDTASKVGGATIPRKGAFQRAARADAISDEEWRNATGHGIHIVYQSGKRRLVTHMDWNGEEK